jgi:hypothetical protein
MGIINHVYIVPMNGILKISTFGNPFWMAAVLVAGLYFLLSGTILRAKAQKPSGEWIRTTQEPQAPILAPGIQSKPAEIQG